MDLKRGGVQVPIMSSQSLGRDLFQSLFADLPEDRGHPVTSPKGFTPPRRSFWMPRTRTRSISRRLIPSFRERAGMDGS